MEPVYLAVTALGLLRDLLSLVLELGLQLASWLLASLAFLLSLPHAGLASLLSLGHGVAMSLLSSLSPEGMQTLCAGLDDDLKPPGPLFAPGGTPEMLSRRLLDALSSDGHALLRQLGDMGTGALRPLACVIHHALSVCLGGAQNLFSQLARWEAAGSVCWMMEVVANSLAYASSGAMTAAIVFWSLCQLTLEFLASAGHLLTVVLFSLTGFVFLAGVMAVTVTVLNPDFTLRLASRALSQLQSQPSFIRLREDVARLNQLSMGLDAWLQAWGRSPLLVRLPNPNPTPTPRGGAPGTSRGGRRRVFSIRIQRQYSLPETVTTTAAEAGGPEGLDDNEPAAGPEAGKMLKEPEDHKKCVICRDRSKCVLLLPCRHLCLCQTCSDILMRHPIHLRNCPLCRRGILRTLKVYV